MYNRSRTIQEATANFSGAHLIIRGWSDYESDVEQFFETLKTNNTVTKLDLSQNNLGDKDAIGIASLLEANHNITDLNLDGNNIGPVGAKAIAEALKTNKTLVKLVLSKNFICNKGAIAIFGALNTNNKLAELGLSYVGINDNDAEVAKALADLLRTNNSLTMLDLSENMFDYDYEDEEHGHKGVTDIFAALQTNNTLTELNLSFTHIGQESAKTIADTLRKNKTLTKLDLSKNHLGDTGATIIAGGLMVNNRLTELNLSDNRRIESKDSGIGHQGATAIADALMANKTLSKLDLSRNNFGDEGVTAIAAALKKNNALVEVNLSSNRNGITGLKAIAVSLNVNKFITTCEIRSGEEGERDKNAYKIMRKIEASTEFNRQIPEFIRSLCMAFGQINKDIDPPPISGIIARNIVAMAIKVPEGYDLPPRLANYVNQVLTSVRGFYERRALENVRVIDSRSTDQKPSGTESSSGQKFFGQSMPKSKSADDDNDDDIDDKFNNQKRPPSPSSPR